MKRSFLFLAEGFEEMEAIAIVDVLRRGGVDIKIVSVSDQLNVRGAHGVSMEADVVLRPGAAEYAAWLIFPGGLPGAQNLSDSPRLIQLLQDHFDRGGRVAAICAAPALVLSKLKTDRKYRMTTYPGFEKYLVNADVVADGVVVDGRIVTGKGPAFALDFGLTVLREIVSQKAADEVARGMLR